MEKNWMLAKKQETLWIRAKMIQAIRGFFIVRDYLEIETSCRIPSPSPEDYIDAMPCGEWFLQTSPEMCMKQLLAADYAKIFQICKCFRKDERGCCHLPEYTMLEWYRRDIDYLALMQECEELINYVASVLGSGDVVHYQGFHISLQNPWERLSVKEAFMLYAPTTMAESIEKGRFDEIMACQIGPHLGNSHPVFLYDYPLSPGSLARVKKEDANLVERFELYMAGIELANAFSELTDEREQRLRFEKAQNSRRLMGKTVYPLPERFLRDLRHTPDSAGIALGVDRLAMIFTNSPKIDDVVSFVPEDL